MISCQFHQTHNLTFVIVTTGLDTITGALTITVTRRQQRPTAKSIIRHVVGSLVDYLFHCPDSLAFNPSVRLRVLQIDEPNI